MLAAVGVDVDHGRRQRTVPGAVIAGIAKEGALVGFALGHHRQVSVIHEQLGRAERGGEHQVVEGLQPPGGFTGPGAQGRAVEIDAVAAEDADLTVERQPIAILGDDDPGQQRRGGRAGSPSMTPAPAISGSTATPPRSGMTVSPASTP